MTTPKKTTRKAPAKRSATATAEAIGEHRPDKARGWLVFASLPKALQNAEDSTQDADFTRGREHWWSTFTLDATDSERDLLVATGVTVPDTLQTKVSFPAAGVRRRRWPALPETDAAS
jgi:hypothetical protein